MSVDSDRPADLDLEAEFARQLVSAGAAARHTIANQLEASGETLLAWLYRSHLG